MGVTSQAELVLTVLNGQPASTRTITVSSMVVMVKINVSGSTKSESAEQSMPQLISCHSVSLSVEHVALLRCLVNELTVTWPQLDPNSVKVFIVVHYVTMLRTVMQILNLSLMKLAKNLFHDSI